MYSIGDWALSSCGSLSGIFFRGNAPSLGNNVFSYASPIVYYLPWATGWGPIYGDLSTAVWTGQIQTTGSDFGLGANQFGFNISGTNGFVTVIEACTNLTNPAWFPVQTNTFTGTNTTSCFTDPAWASSAARFYRLRSP